MFNILQIFVPQFFYLQEGVTSLRHDVLSDEVNNEDNSFDENEETENGEKIVNLSNGFSENSMSGAYQHQSRSNHVSCFYHNISITFKLNCLRKNLKMSCKALSTFTKHKI